MNQRIRELAEQALFESDFDDEQNIKITMDIFAELIVRECASIVDNAVNHREPASTYVGKIKEHFGVLE